jgi:3-oxoadipate enol-lactonase
MLHEQTTAVRGRRVRYLESGLGRPIVLLHAFPMSADMWRPQLDRLPKGWRLIAPDLRGFGGSNLDGPELGMDDYAGDVVALLDTLSLERAVIGGLSMGGYVTFAVFRLAPERFSGMILADTRSTADTEDGVRARRTLLESVRARGVGAVADTMPAKLLGETSHRERPALVADVRAQIASNPASGIEAAIYALMTRPDSTADLPRIACPTLVIVGAEDGLTPVSDAEALRDGITGARLAVLPRAGHLSNLEAAEDFSHTIGEWLASLP